METRLKSKCQEDTSNDNNWGPILLFLRLKELQAEKKKKDAILWKARIIVVPWW